MNLGLGGTTFGMSRTLAKHLLDHQVYGSAQSSIEEKFNESGLLASAPFEWLFVNKQINQLGPDRILLPTSYLRRPDWKLNVRTGEYVAPFNLNVSLWEWKDAKSRAPNRQNLSYLHIDEMRRQIEGCTLAVISQVALEFGHDRDQVLPLLDGYDLDIDAIFLAHETWRHSVKGRRSSKKASTQSNRKEKWVSMEVSFTPGGGILESSLERRQQISNLLATALVQAKLEPDGMTSGGGTLDIGFIVSDFARAKSLVQGTLQEAGHDSKEFHIYSLDSDTKVD